MKTGLNLVELATEIERQTNAAKDYVATTRALVMERNTDLLIGQGEVTPVRASVGDIAHRQIGSFLDIPAKYYDRMRASEPDLLADNVNRWMVRKEGARMVRTLDGRTRAFLSDRYHRIDNWQIASAALPALQERPGLVVRSAQITERKLYLTATLPTLQGEVKVGDVVEAGLKIENSEVGFGRYTVTPVIYQLKCLNGWKVDIGGFKKTHVGARADVGDETYAMLSDETLEADDKALMLKTRDVVRGLLSEDFFQKTLNRMKESTERRITGDPVKAVEVLSSSFQLREDERGSVLRHLIEGGDLSAWGVGSAVTRAAQDVENWDRDEELQAIGGKIIDLPKSDWTKIAEAA